MVCKGRAGHEGNARVHMLKDGSKLKDCMIAKPERGAAGKRKERAGAEPGAATAGQDLIRGCV